MFLWIFLRTYQKRGWCAIKMKTEKLSYLGPPWHLLKLKNWWFFSNLTYFWTQILFLQYSIFIFGPLKIVFFPFGGPLGKNVEKNISCFFSWSSKGKKTYFGILKENTVYKIINIAQSIVVVGWCKKIWFPKLFLMC